jgi:hypothetical protein
VTKGAQSFKTNRRLSPPCSICLGNALYIDLLIKLVSFLGLARLLRAAVAVCVLFTNGDVDEVHCASVFKLGSRGWIGCALVDVAGTIFVIVELDLEVWDGATGIEVRDVGLGEEVLLRNVAVVGCLHPVSGMDQ